MEIAERREEAGEKKSVHEPVFHSVIDQFGIVFETGFFEDTGSIGADGGNTQVELGGDILDTQPPGDEMHDLKFPIGQVFMGEFLQIGVQGKSQFLRIVFKVFSSSFLASRFSFMTITIPLEGRGPWPT